MKSIVLVLANPPAFGRGTDIANSQELVVEEFIIVVKTMRRI